MATPLTRADVEAIAALANLELDAAELELFTRQLGAVLEYAAEVREVDTAGVPPTASVTAAPPAERPDAVQPCLPVDEALANAPDPAGGKFFRVPRVMT